MSKHVLKATKLRTKSREHAEKELSQMIEDFKFQRNSKPRALELNPSMYKLLGKPITYAGVDVEVR
jgi:predicted DNA binding CopG/RHH family protein